MPTAYTDVLARNIRAARSRLGINQETLAGRMQALGFSAWLRQTVANVEKGRRRVTAEEIFGLGFALETSMSALIRATDDDRFVSFPSGEAIAAVTVRRSAEGRNDGAVQWDGTKPLIDETVLRQFVSEGTATWTRISRSTGEVESYNPETGEWARREPPGGGELQS